MESVELEFTPIEEKMLNILRDGRAHSKKELCSCGIDDEGNGFYTHITRINKKLRLINQEVRPARSAGIANGYYFWSRIVSITADD